MGIRTVNAGSPTESDHRLRYPQAVLRAALPLSKLHIRVSWAHGGGDESDR